MTAQKRTAMTTKGVKSEDLNPPKQDGRKPRCGDVDRYIGQMIRARRMLLGLTQHQMADLIGVTYQQAHKYENGINRVASGRLYGIAKALGVGIEHFVEGFDDGAVEPAIAPRILTMSSLFQRVRPVYQDALIELARKLAEPEDAGA